MLGRSVGIAATCALGASAFLLPPGIAPASNNEDSALAGSLSNSKTQVITVPCASCAFPTQQEKVEEEDDQLWIQGGANSILLNFTVSEGGQRLQLNGGDIYPPHFQSFTQRAIYVKQVPSQASLKEILSEEARSADLEVTAYGLKEDDKEVVSSEGDMVVPLRFEIMGLENEFMNIGEVMIKLLQTNEGELLIMDVEHDIMNGGSMFEDIPFPPPPPGPDDMPEDMTFTLPRPHHGPPPDFKCNMLPEPLCKLKALVDSKIDQAMSSHRPNFRKMGGGCRGRKGGPHGMKLPGHIKPHLDIMPGQEDDRPAHHHGRPHHTRPHGQHHGPHHGHHGHFGHHVLHNFAKGLVAVLIPVMAGISVGMIVSLVGLVVGRIIGFAWIKFARGGRRGYASVAQQEIALEDGEVKAMVAEMEAPPVYENAPAYVEVEKE